MKIRSMTLFIILFASVFLFPQQIEREILVNESETVYINSGESEFHLRKCEKLGESHYSSMLKMALSRGFTPCPICIPFKEIKQPIIPIILPEKIDSYKVRVWWIYNQD